MRASLLLSLVVLAGCGKNSAPGPYDLGACGVSGDRCCDGEQCYDGSLCVTGFCHLFSCGDEGEACCTGNCHGPDLKCLDGFCKKSCGHLYDACCSDGSCSDQGTVCSADKLCEVPRAPTGAPCNYDIDCDGNSPRCLLKDPDGTPWPSGYCTSSCDSKRSDPVSQLNPDCPGGGGVCQSVGNNSFLCWAGCTAMSGPMPCRSDYACFYFCYQDPCVPYCRPSAESQCDPTDPASCGMGMGCISSGLDNVGYCQTSCNLFAQDCDQGSACYVIDDTGRGFCYDGGAVGDGSPCMYLNDCAPGLTCFLEGNSSVCRPFCGGPMNVLCTNGKGCVDFSTKVKVAVVGVCSG